MSYRVPILETLAGAALLSGGALAGDSELSVRGALSGLWFDADRPGHGLQVQVINPREAVLTWYAYDESGAPLWLLGVGAIEDNVIRATLSSYSGGSFPPDFDPAAVSGESWGEVSFSFADCTSATIDWMPEQPGFTAGSTDLTRLTATEGDSCGVAETFHRVAEFSFDAGPGQWSALFADYGEAQQDSIDTAASWTELPPPLGNRDGFMLAGTNTSDSLAMFLTAPIGGLAPDTEYDLELAMTFATAVPQDCAGIGGSPGSSVFVKLGATGTEPEVVREGDEFRLNIDKGNQSRGGDDAVVVGDMANFQENCPDDSQWQLKRVSTGAADFSARSDEAGTLWIYAGTDSGFEGRTVYFITDFSARLMVSE